MDKFGLLCLFAEASLGLRGVQICCCLALALCDYVVCKKSKHYR